MTAPPAFLSFLVAGAGVFVAMRGWNALRMRRALRALAQGEPRSCRARVRALARSTLPPPTDWVRHNEAVALFWEGDFERAMARGAVLASDGFGASFRSSAEALQILCLIFLDRAGDARRLLDLRRATLCRRASRGIGLDEHALEAILLFHEGDTVGSRVRLEACLRRRQAHGPGARIALYHLAAIAHKQGRGDDARPLLGAAIRAGGSLFIARWAAETHAELFPRSLVPLRGPARPSTPEPTSGWRRLARDLRVGLGFAFFRPPAEVARGYGYDAIARLGLVNLTLALVLHSSAYSRRATFLPIDALAVAAPIVLCAIASYAATLFLRRPDCASRLAGGFYGVMPVLLLVQFAAFWLGDGEHAFAQSMVRAAFVLWSIAAVRLLVRRIDPRAGILRRVVTVVLFSAAWVIPSRATDDLPLWFEPRYDDFAARHHEEVALLYAQADAVHAAESHLLPGRPGTVDLYFVAFAGWADQDVFFKEVTFAKKLFDDRFDTRGRSLAMANDPDARRTLPMATKINLEHVLKTVGEKMNREEDVLFLFLTSHGSTRGVGIEPDGLYEDYSERVLSPNDLRAALDTSGIKWRVIVVSACESGGFVGPLRNEFTLIVTAAASDRRSFGCANGVQFTEFGRAVFAEQLTYDRSFETAFGKAIAVIGQREADRKLEASRPQLFIGSAVSAKLTALQERLETEAAAAGP